MYDKKNGMQTFYGFLEASYFAFNEKNKVKK